MAHAGHPSPAVTWQASLLVQRFAVYKSWPPPGRSGLNHAPTAPSPEM